MYCPGLSERWRLVGKQGCGKGHVWETIERLMGVRACFTTSKPDKDVWGDNNGKMKDAFFVRVTESDKKKFAIIANPWRTDDNRAGRTAVVAGGSRAYAVWAHAACSIVHDGS